MVKGEQESVERKGFCSFDSSEFLTSISDLKFHKISWVNLLSKFRLSQSVCLSLKKKSNKYRYHQALQIVQRVVRL